MPLNIAIPFAIFLISFSMLIYYPSAKRKENEKREQIIKELNDILTPKVSLEPKPPAKPKLSYPVYIPNHNLKMIHDELQKYAPLYEWMVSRQVFRILHLELLNKDNLSTNPSLLDFKYSIPHLSATPTQNNATALFTVGICFEQITEPTGNPHPPNSNSNPIPTDCTAHFPYHYGAHYDIPLTPALLDAIQKKLPAKKKEVSFEISNQIKNTIKAYYKKKLGDNYYNNDFSY